MDADLSDSAQEMVDMYWNEMSEKESFQWAKDNTDFIGEDDGEVDGAIEMPKQFAPLGDLPGIGPKSQMYALDADYRRTQRLARAMSVHRSAELLLDRGLAHVGEIVGTAKGSPEWKAAAVERVRGHVEFIDKLLWSQWKSSSTTKGGELLQMAIADELGGRVRTAHFSNGGREATIAYANNEHSEIGGYEGIKAYVRGKWETTQYLLDKADLQKLDLYRAVNIPIAANEPIAMHQNNYRQMPNVQVERNGAASMTAKRSVANEWNGSQNRIVLRAEVPRTAVVSVPAYGINLTEEVEVVVAGTGWVGWDAWNGYAPEFDEVPLGAQGVDARLVAGSWADLPASTQDQTKVQYLAGKVGKLVAQGSDPVVAKKMAVDLWNGLPNTEKFFQAKMSNSSSLMKAAA
jgi:hypothetical protein